MPDTAKYDLITRSAPHGWRPAARLLDHSGPPGLPSEIVGFDLGQLVTARPVSARLEKFSPGFRGSQCART